MHFHKGISFVAFAFVLAHPALIVLDRPERRDLLNPFTAPWTARLGVFSVLALVALLVTSLWRRQLRLSYEVWRVAHGVLAVVIVVTALVHVARVDYYVSGPWKRGLWVAMSVVLLALLVNVRLVKPLRLLRRPWCVSSVAPERGSCWTVTLRPDGHAGVSFLPGQFAWLRIDRSPFSVREHPFSFASSAERSDEVSFTIKEAGDFTSTIGSVQPGTRVYLDGPYGVFTYERNERAQFAFVAGGIGIAPIMSMLRTLADRGDRRPIVLFYGSATWDEVTFREELDELRGRLDLEILHVIEHPPDDWRGARGFIDAELLAAHLPARRASVQCLMCGPPPMMDAVYELLVAQGVPAANIDHERFELT
jgi:predicted ferric reductase